MSGKTAKAHEGKTLLDMADDAGVFIDSACRFGSCGTCMVKLKTGRVAMSVEDALTDGDKEEGYVLACQAEPKGLVELES